MPKLSVSQPHTLEPETLSQRVSVVEDKLRNRYRAQTRWIDERTMEVSGPGVKGQVTLGAETIDVDLDLGFMLGPLRGQLEQGLREQLQKVTAP